jgi:hypothetical protein
VLRGHLIESEDDVVLLLHWHTDLEGTSAEVEDVAERAPLIQFFKEFR